mmetsp:Transcript_18529/g.26632  ORF Transcript_18529/g.26632 Transcript_18529/m.26632 type:complete len:89 (-) Transcript_18529:55-321(-)
MNLHHADIGMYFESTSQRRLIDSMVQIGQEIPTEGHIGQIAPPGRTEELHPTRRNGPNGMKMWRCQQDPPPMIGPKAHVTTVASLATR